MQEESAVIADFTCAVCDKADSVDSLLQCDFCDKWYHYECAHVDKTVETRAWWCAECEVKTKLASGKKDDEIARLKREMEALKATTEKALALIREKDAEVARLSKSSERTSFSPGESLPCSTAKRISVNEEGDLSQSQIAARQAVRYELPSFNGNPEEWPIFLSTFRRSSRTFGFTEDENILRLQGALRGKALRTVQGRLRHADNLEEILSALEKSYGRPDVLVNTLLEQIRESPPIKSERLDSFIEYGDLVAEICSTIKASGTSDRLYDAALLQELVDRMPAYLRWSWGMHSQELKSVTMSEFGAWIQKATDGAMAVTPPQLKKKTTTRQVHAQHVETHQPQPNRHRECALCNSDTCGTIAECRVFNRLSVADRWDKVRTFKLCKRCLGKHYGPCSKRDDCGVQGCVAKHHRKLHRVTSEERVEINHHGTRSDGTLLRYVPVKLHGESGPIYTHALLDEGSTVTLMEQELARQLGVSGVLDPLCLQYSAGERRDERDSERVAVQVSSAEENASAFSMADVRTVSRLSLPIQSVDVNELKRKYKHLEAIPAASYEAVSPRLLIGIDHYRLTRPLKTIEGQPGQPTATKTRLGWLIFGKCTDNANDTSIVQPESSYHVCDCQGETSRADRMMAAYFEVEGYGPAKEPLLSKEDQRAMSILQNNTKHVDGRYTTGLLWRSDNVFMPENRQMALSRMECLERKMSRDTSLAEKINAILEDYLKKGYARPIREDELKTFYPRKWYLPVFPVTNPNKPNKVRLVWDAAAEVRGISLNKKLLTGPDLLTPLQAVLFRFREYRVAVAADIREMYHQVRICDDDVHSQRFLWRWGNTNAEPQEFVMLRMTFGAACSPSTAQFVKNENAEKYRSLYPRAVRCIHEEHYVDDMLTSVETEPEAIELAYQVSLIHNNAGFSLHNWLSNSIKVATAVKGTESTLKEIDFEPCLKPEKVLGMWWDTTTDSFGFKLSRVRHLELARKDKPPSKRQMLRTLMSIYDPLGLIAGVLFYLKVLLQEVWRLHLGWDDEVPEEIQHKWDAWMERLPELESFIIPRCYRQLASLTESSLHVFVDAGADGYAAVAYFRFECHGRIEVSLVGSKARVAPLKYLSVPRLELQAAVMGCRIASSITSAHRETISGSYFWTDSTDVIDWINADHRKYSIFVAHRVAEVLDTTNVDDWRWLPTKLNVADEATKWTNLQHHLASERWFSGPEFLQLPEAEWNIPRRVPSETSEEVRKKDRLKLVGIHIARPIFIDYERFSRWTRLVRTMAYVCRYVNIITKTKSPSTGPLNRDEIQRAETVILRDVQRNAFTDEYAILWKARENSTTPSWKSPIPRSSLLFKRSPYMDEDGLLRLSGRIDRCRYVDPGRKRPILLPRRHRVSELIVDDVHRRYKHGSQETVVNEVRQRFDIPALRSVCRHVRLQCRTCTLLYAKPASPEMCELPAARLAAFSRPFSYTGIDYFGPMVIVNGRKTEKRWGVLFTCLTVRAVHIELVQSLSTSDCLMAVRSFMARRGTPIEIVSDRGTNFVGADRELKEAAERVDSAILNEFGSPDPVWKFNPPAAPHFGGSWERMIQSVKRMLSRTLTERHPTEAVLSAALIEVENMLNSRPLTHVPVDGEDEEPLTPNHFLLGSSAGMKPLVKPDDSPAGLKQNWRAVQAKMNELWKKWIKTYLPTLVRRTKWFESCKPIETGDVVLIVDENSPRNCWPRGRVERVVPSKDGVIRRVVIKTAKGTMLERPVVKLVSLNVAPRVIV